jgi:hypothetical protein
VPVISCDSWSLREQRLVDVEEAEQLVGPFAVDDVEQQHAAGVAHLGRVLAGHAEADVILRKQHVLRLRVNLRLLLPHPEDLGRGEAGQRRVGDELDQRLAPPGLRFDLSTLGGRPLVVPQQSRPQGVLAVA